MRWWVALTSLLGFACGQSGALPNGAIVRDGGPRTGACAYPDGAVEPMTKDQVLWPYRWPGRSMAGGGAVSVDLEDAYCNTDDDMDWSPFDVLLFVSVPAW